MSKLGKIIRERKALKKELGIKWPTFAKTEMLRVKAVVRRRKMEEAERERFKEKLRKLDEEEEKRVRAREKNLARDFVRGFERVEKRGKGEIRVAGPKPRTVDLEFAVKKIEKIKRLIKEGELIGEDEVLINKRKRELRAAEDEYAELLKKR